MAPWVRIEPMPPRGTSELSARSWQTPLLLCSEVRDSGIPYRGSNPWSVELVNFIDFAEGYRNGSWSAWKVTFIKHSLLIDK